MSLLRLVSPLVSSVSTALSLTSPVGLTPRLPLALMTSRRYYQNRGVLRLRCPSCRYVIRRWHIPILSVDCNANRRHKQALTTPQTRTRPIPEHILPFLTGKAALRYPLWRQDHTYQCYSKLAHRKLR